MVRDEKDGVTLNGNRAGNGEGHGDSSGSAAGHGDGDPRRWRALALVSLAVLLGMSVWFTVQTEHEMDIVLVDEAASTAGLRRAAGEAVVLMDADLQDPPEVIVELVERWREGYELVFATRSDRAGEGWFKRLTSAVFYRVLRRVVNFDFPTDTGDFRLMARPVVEGFLQMPERNRFVRGMVAWTGFRATSVEYTRAPRRSGRTNYNYGKLVVLALDALTGFSAVPIRLVSLFGFFVTALSAIGTVWIVFNKLVLGIPIPGYAFLVTGVLFLGGVQILMLGMIGEYVGRIYVETQRRPLYLVSESGGLDSNDRGAVTQEGSDFVAT